MQSKELWESIEDFPDYLVSNEGRVINAITDRVKTPSVNQQGIPHVLLMREGQQFRRSLSVLVAKAFLDPDHPEQFDTPINLNGDRQDNRSSNLMWRPRWFAIVYHRDMLQPRIRRHLEYGYVNIRDGNAFEDERAAAMTYGVREMEVFLSAVNNEPVFPTWDIFRFDD